MLNPAWRREKQKNETENRKRRIKLMDSIKSVEIQFFKLEFYFKKYIS